MAVVRPLAALALAMLLLPLASEPVAGICDPEYLSCPATAYEEVEDGVTVLTVGGVGVTLDLRRILHENEQSILAGSSHFTSGGDEVDGETSRSTTQFRQGDEGFLVVRLESTGANVTNEQVWLGVDRAADGFHFGAAHNASFAYSDADSPVTRTFPFTILSNATAGGHDLKFGIAVGHADGGTYTYDVTVKKDRSPWWKKTPAAGLAFSVAGLLALAAVARRRPE